MKKSIYIISFFYFFFTSCKSTFDITIKKDFSEKLSKNNYNQLNGTYKNYPEKFIGGLRKTPHNYHSDNSIVSLFGNHLNPHSKTQVELQKATIVNLNFINSKRIKLKLYRENELIAERIIKGEIKNGYFYSKYKKVIYPFLPLFFGYHFERFRIRKEKDQLFFDYHINSWVAGFMVGESSKGDYSAIFKKIDLPKSQR